VCPVFEDGLARSVWIRQYRRVHVDDDLVSLCGCARIDTVVQRRLGDEDQRVRLLLAHRRRFRGNVSCVRLLIEGLTGRGQRLHEHGADLRRQPPADDDHAVFVLIHVQGAARVAPRGLPYFRLPIDPPPAADDALDVLGGAGPADGEQPLFRFWRRDAGQRTDLRVRQLAAAERLRQSWQRAQRASYPDALAGRAPVEPDAPRQPRGAGVEASVPAAARVELADEIQKARGSGIEVGGELGDLVAEAIHLRGGANDGLKHGLETDVRRGVHR